MLANHYVILILIVIVGSGASGSLGCPRAQEGGLTVVLFEVGTRSSRMTFLPTQMSAELLWGATNRRFSVGRLRRHTDPVGPRLAENLEVNL